MKYIFLIAIIFIICRVSYGQEFEVITAEDQVIKGIVGEKIIAPIAIKNTSDKPIYIIVERIEKRIGSTQSTNLCWGKECYESDQKRIPVSKRINPGEVSHDLASVLEAGLVSGYSTVTYHIYTRSDRQTYIEHEVTYDVEEKYREKALFSSKSMIFNEIYPNPVKEYAIINYKITDPQIDAKVVLHNVLGSAVATYKLSPLEQTLKIDTKPINPGIYFYTLFVDGEGKLTKKLVIRK